MLQDNAKPFAVATHWRVPIPLLEPVRKELDRMEKMEVISPIQEPTNWCTGMVPLWKKNRQVFMCVDLIRLSKSVKRELHPILVVERITPNTGGKACSGTIGRSQSVLQAWRKLTIFIILFGRYYYNRLPFGIMSAPEHLSQKNLGDSQWCDWNCAYDQWCPCFRKKLGKTR